MPPPKDNAPASEEETGAPMRKPAPKLGSNEGSGAETFQTEGRDGSYSPDDPARPRWVPGTRIVAEYDYHLANDRYAYTKIKGQTPAGEKVFQTGQRRVGNDLQIDRMNWPEQFYKYEGLTHFMRGEGDAPYLLYRLPELISELAARPADPIYICEGEKDVDRLRRVGLIATCNPNGALGWRPDYNALFANRDVVIMVDNDAKGRKRAAMLIDALGSVGSC